MEKANKDSIIYNIKGLCEVYLERYREYFDSYKTIRIKVGAKQIECQKQDFTDTMISVFLDDALMEKADEIKFEVNNKVLDSIQINH